MGATVQVRLDAEMQEKLNRAARRLGLSRSEALREGIRLVDKRASAHTVPRLIGIGCFDSGINDLATNKGHMKDFGVRSMGRGWRRPEDRSSKRKARAK